MDYEKLYKEAISRADKHYARHIVEDIFPELKKSEDERIEDERIRKALLKHFSQMPEHGYLTGSDVTFNDAISWLEKQDETSFDEEWIKLLKNANIQYQLSMNENMVDDAAKLAVDGLKKLKIYEIVERYVYKQGEENKSVELMNALQAAMIELAKQGEQKPIIIIPQFKVGDIIKPKPYNEEHLIKDINENGYVLDVDIIIPFKDENVWEIVEQKTAWREEDERILYNVVACVDFAAGQRGVRDDAFREANHWLKSLKDRVQPQPNQEWTEEDDYVYNEILKRVADKKLYEHDLEYIYTWLKSLKPNHWKPSDEQLKALRWVLNNIPYNQSKEEISELLEQLKKL